jgi:hypothetical protein
MLDWIASKVRHDDLCGEELDIIQFLEDAEDPSALYIKAQLMVYGWKM